MQTKKKLVAEQIEMFSAYNRPPRKRISFEGEKSRTQQHFASEVNINEIMKRAQNGGEINTRQGMAFYGDFRDVKNYQEAQNLVIEADQAFMALSPEIRNRFRNNPGELLDFLENKENEEEAIKLGLIEAKDQATAQKAPLDKPKAERAVNETPEASKAQ